MPSLRYIVVFVYTQERCPRRSIHLQSNAVNGTCQTASNEKWGRMTDSVLKHEIAEEQAHVTRMYDRLDVLRERAAADLRRVHGEETTGTDQAWSERESLSTLYSGRHAQLSSVERGLCFGRIDNLDETRFQVGRIGLFDDDYEPILVDWRAPAAQAFYRATPANPLGVARRRHIRLHGRTVVAVDDDV